MKYFLFFVAFFTFNCFADDKPNATSHLSNGVCSMEAKINSVGAVLKVDGKSYRCTRVLKEKNVFEYVWVPIEIKDSSFVISE